MRRSFRSTIFAAEEEATPPNLVRIDEETKKNRKFLRTVRIFMF